MMRHLVGASLLLCAGCGGGQQEPSSSSTTNRTAWIASADGVGPVQIGMSRADAAAALDLPSTSDSGTGECELLRSSQSPDGVLVMSVGGHVARVDVTRPGVATRSGIEVGTGEAQVLAAYGGAVSISPHKYTDGRYLTVVPDAGRRIVFETDGQRVTRYRVGRLPEVEWVEGCS